MKQTLPLRLLSLLMVLVIVLGTSVYAADTEEPLPSAYFQTTQSEDAEPAQPDAEAPALRLAEGDEALIQQYGVPDDWSRPALLFALRNDLLHLRDGALCPRHYATRAEVAVMIMSVMKTKRTYALGAYWDVSEDDWYYDALSRAKALGVMVGTDEHHMEPNSRITREEVFTILSRAFGAETDNLDCLFDFDDWSSVSSWAKAPTAGLVEAGYVHGDGTNLCPGEFLSREELCQIFYNVIQDVGTEIPAEYDGSFALTATTVPAGTVVNGDLLLVAETGSLVLNDITVTGKLIIQGKDYLYLTLDDCVVGELVLCRNTELYSYSGWISRIRSNAYLNIQNSTHGTVTALYDLCVGPNARLLRLNTADPGQTVTVNGTVDELNVNNKNVTVNGTGTVETLNVYKSGANVSCQVGTRNDDVDPGLSTLRASKAVDNKPTVASPTIPVTIRLSDVPAGSRLCYVTWYINGEQVTGHWVFRLGGDMDMKANLNFKEYLRSDTDDLTAKVTMVLNYQDEERSFTFSYDTSDALVQAAKQVRTQNVQGVINYTTSVYSNSGLGGYITTVSKGTVVTYITYNGSTSRYIQLPNGTRGWIPYGALYVNNNAKFYVTWDYSKQVKEYYINNIKKAGSSTGYLIWCNTYTQRVNVFQGSKGKWKLIHSYPCATGQNYCLTKVQDTKILYKTSAWSFSNFYVHSVSVVDGAGRAFHSRPKAYDGSVYEWTMSRPISHGCIRMLDDGVNFIYKYVPVGTTVIIF